MDKDVKFLIERMDKLEDRLVKKIDDLQAFKNRLLGMAIFAGGVTSLIINLIVK